MIRSRRIFVVSSALLSFITGAASLADVPNRAEMVAEILERGEKRVPGATDAARELYEQARDDSPRDLRVDYAFALVLLRQQAYDESLKILRTLQSNSSGATRVLCGRLQVWVLLQQKSYKNAVQQIETMGGSLAPPVGSVKQDALTVETAEFFGRVFAYLTHAQPKSVDPVELQRVEDSLKQHMSLEASAAFTRGFDNATKTYEHLTEEIRIAKARAPSVYRTSLSEINDERSAAAEQAEKLQQEIDKLNAEAQARLADADEAIRKADEIVIQAIGDLRSAQSHEDLQNGKNSQSNKNGYSSPEVLEAQRRLDIANAYLARETSRRAQLKSNVQQVVNARAEPLRRQQRHLQVLEARQKQLVNAGPYATANLEAYNRKLSLLTTYIDPPFEAEKKRILASYAK